jgi:ATP-dependent RNA helicase MSS116
LKGLKVLILDEADNLLNMGFRPAIEKILRYLPSQRQTLLFSATIPPQVHTVSKLALKPNNQFIDTVGEETEQTNIQVRVCWLPTELTCSVFTTILILEFMRTVL